MLGRGRAGPTSIGASMPQTSTISTGLHRQTARVGGNVRRHDNPEVVWRSSMPKGVVQDVSGQGVVQFVAAKVNSTSPEAIRKRCARLPRSNVHGTNAL